MTNLMFQSLHKMHALKNNDNVLPTLGWETDVAHVPRELDPFTLDVIVHRFYNNKKKILGVTSQKPLLAFSCWPLHSPIKNDALICNFIFFQNVIVHSKYL